jgi:hypothetical protein
VANVIVTDIAENSKECFNFEDEGITPFRSVGNCSTLDRRRISQQRMLYVEAMSVRL